MLLYAFLITPYSLILQQLLPEFLLPRKVHTFLDLTQIKKTLQKEYLQNKSEYREMVNATTNINMLIGMDRTKAYDKQR